MRYWKHKTLPYYISADGIDLENRHYTGITVYGAQKQYLFLSDLITFTGIAEQYTILPIEERGGFQEPPPPRHDWDEIIFQVPELSKEEQELEDEISKIRL